MIWKLTSDKVLFPAVQIALLIFLLLAVIKNSIQAGSAGQGEIAIEIVRGNVSMGLFYGTYAAISGILIAICLRVDIAANHRVFWSILDAIQVGYLCLYNGWFRNLLLQWVTQLSKIESR